VGRTRPVKEKQAARRAAREKAKARPANPVPASPFNVALPPAAPTVGRIVLVHRTVGAAFPAIVTHVHGMLDEEEPHTVSLVVFNAHNGENEMPAESLRWVRYGEQPGQWFWPSRVA